MPTGFTHESTRNNTVEWYTPRSVFDALGLHFDLDPCSPGRDITPWVPAREVYTRDDDGLQQPWNGRVWLNPPYGPHTQRWLARLAEHGNGVALVFARTDTGWFHQHACRADLVCFIQGRIRFIDSVTRQPANSPGAGSMLLAYGRECAAAVATSGLGNCFRLAHTPNGDPHQPELAWPN